MEEIRKFRLITRAQHNSLRLSQAILDEAFPGNRHTFLVAVGKGIVILKEMDASMTLVEQTELIGRAYSSYLFQSATFKRSSSGKGLSFSEQWLTVAGFQTHEQIGCALVGSTSHPTAAFNHLILYPVDPADVVPRALSKEFSLADKRTGMLAPLSNERIGA